MPRYIEENEIYKLFNARGVAQLHVGDIDVLPRVEAKEVVHGAWLSTGMFGVLAKCSACGVENHTIEYVLSVGMNYCPYCGAKKDLEE